MHTITKKPEYWEIRFSGEVRADGFIEAINDLMSQPGYPPSREMSRLDDCQVLISAKEFGMLINAISLMYPANARRTKTAMVVKLGVVAAIAKMWTEAAQILPSHDFCVFSEVDKAEKWLAEQSN